MTLQIYKIASVTVGSGGTSSIDFTSIPQGYKDLILKVSIRTNYSGSNYGYINLAFNGSTANFSNKRLLGYSSGVNSSTATQFMAPQNDDAATSSTFSNMEIYIPNYTSSNYKSISVDSVSENNSSASESAFCSLLAGIWSSSSAINQLTISPWSSYGTLINQYSTATLYGIL